MTSRLYNRRATVAIGNMDVSLLRIAFQITRSLTATPNAGTVQVYNLSATSRKRASEAETVQVQAGYEETDLTQVFVGDIDRVVNVRQEGRWVTTIHAGDSFKKITRRRSSRSFAAGSKLGNILKTLAEDVGLPSKALLNEIDKGNYRKALSEFTHGFSVVGKSFDELQKVARSAGIKVYVDNGELRGLQEANVIENRAAVISPTTGLLGSPEKDEGGTVRVRSYIQPGLEPGFKIKLESREFPGEFFKIRSVRYTGDTHGRPWYAEMEATPHG